MKLKKIFLAATAGLLLVSNPQAWAQGFATLHNFTNLPDGANPKQLAAMNGLLYGSTAYGGSSGNGAIFQFNTNGTGFSTIYSFTGPINSGGSAPNNLLVTSNMIYGTTAFGGTNGVGMIFAVNTNGTGFTPLYSFSLSQDGFYPQAGLVLGGATLYGAANNGGTNGGGALFKINTNGSGYAILHWFTTNSTDGFSPQSELVLSGNTLYGTTTSGGVSNVGTIFAINTNGTGFTVMHSFTSTPDGSSPLGGLVLNAGVLYGTTRDGGANTNAGTIFAINTDGSGYRILYHFSYTGGATNADGKTPKATLTSNGGYLYGTASSGGNGAGGTLFLISTNGTGFTVLRSFTNSSATGSDLENGAIRLGNAVYGTAYTGGTGSFGTVYSLTLPPIITLQPQSVTVTNGNPASFTVGAADGSPMSYQWYFNTNTLLTGQTNSSLNFASAATTNGGTYTVVVSDNVGSVTSSPASLTVIVVITPPAITQQPQNYTVTNGNSASFTNVATGTAPLAYQWYFNTNTPVGGGTNAILLLPAANTNQAGYYTVVVTNAGGNVTSSPARLTVIVPVVAPAITQQPQNYTVTNGYTASFTNVASGTAPLAYQWYFNTNTPVAGGTNSILLVPFAATNQAGYYTVIVTNIAGKATSAPARLTVISTKPVIITQPQPVIVAAGDSADFSVLAAGQGVLKYQWYGSSVSNSIGSPLAGRTNSTYSVVTSTNTNGRFYSVVITNTLGKATSTLAMVTVVTAPIITTNPQPTNVVSGAPASFTVGVLGVSVLHYQWYFNTNTALAGATNSTLAFSAVSNSLAGGYTVVITNIYGRATSSPAALTIQTAAGQPKLLNYSFNPASRSFSLTVTNTANSPNRLWASTNLTGVNFWQVIASNVMAANGLWQFTDTNIAKTNNVRFYRASSP